MHAGNEASHRTDEKFETSNGKNIQSIVQREKAMKMKTLRIGEF